MDFIEGLKTKIEFKLRSVQEILDINSDHDKEMKELLASLNINY
jgi:hypothetical protein